MRDHGAMHRFDFLSGLSMSAVILAIANPLCASTHAPAPVEPFRYEPGAADPSAFPSLDQGASAAQGDAAAQGENSASNARTSLRFGAADSTAFEVNGSAASDFDGVSLGIVDAGVTWYVADGIGFGVFAEGLYASLGDGAGAGESGGDSWGGGGGALVRWIFVREESWSMFAEAGCGVVVSSEAIPDRGSTTNFTPRVNIGATFELSSTSALLVRAGWFHMSNAQTGDENDGVDAAAIGLGLSFAF